MQELEGRVCIVGAGMSGIVAAKHLDAAGIDFDWFEKSSSLGGVWCYREDPGVFSIYDCCRTIGCKHTMSFFDFPVPEDMEEYPTHRDYFRYLRDYAEHFGLTDKVTLDTEVSHIGRRENGGWDVRLGDGETRTYGHVIVASGQFHTPMTPTYPGTFSGSATHSAHYRTAAPYREKRVLVVGLGNSGVDIACDVARVAKQTFLSTRESAHIIPKNIFGRPFLHYHSPVDDYLPFSVSQKLTKALAFAGRGSLSSYSFPEPKREVLLKNPVMSDKILDAVKGGDVVMKPAVERLNGDDVLFDDGSRETVDAIIYATGYRMQFAFFDPDFMSFEGNRFENFLHVVNIENPTLYFVGIVDPFGTYPNIVELQSQMVVSLLTGRCSLPGRSAMQREVATYERKMRRMLKDDSGKPVLREKFFLYQHKLKAFMKKHAAAR